MKMLKMLYLFVCSFHFEYVFILRKDYNAEERREILLNLCSVFDVEGIDRIKLIAGLQNSGIREGQWDNRQRAGCGKAARLVS